MKKQNGAAGQGKDTILSIAKKAENVDPAGTAVQVIIAT